MISSAEDGALGLLSEAPTPIGGTTASGTSSAKRSNAVGRDSLESLQLEIALPESI